MKVHLFASGSKGNLTYVSSQDCAFLIDCGISFRRLSSKCKENSINLSEINTLFITHEHSDHISGLASLLKRGSILTVYLTAGTLLALPDDVKETMKGIEIIKAGQKLQIGNTIIEVVETSHDAAEPVGFVISEHDKKLVYLTDTGYIHQDFLPIIENADLYILECNHCPQMLETSKRPYVLKERIRGIKGHMSNDAAARIISWAAKKPCIWVASHISQECNSSLAINKEINRTLKEHSHIKVILAKQDDNLIIKL